MQCIQTQSEGLSRVFRVVIDRGDLQAKLDQKIDQVRGRVQLKGFRPGKAPAAHIKKIYGQGLLRELIDEEVQRGTREALKDVRPASEPHLHLETDIERVTSGEADLAFHFHVEVLPDFTPVDPSGVELERLTAPVSEEQVEEAVRDLLKANADWAEKEGAAEEGDALTIDFVGKIDGEAFEGGSAEEARVVIGSNQFIPGFEDGLKGLSAGAEKALEVRFPEGYAASHLAGKEAVFDVKVRKVEAPVESTLDDAFAQKFGLESAEAVRRALRERIEAEHNRQSRLKLKRALFDKLDAAHDFELPPSMVEAEFQQIWRQVEQDRETGSLDAEDAAKSEDELKADYRRIAERRVRLGLVLAEIGRLNNVQVSDQELGAALAARARQFPGQEQQVFDFYRSNAGALAQLRAPIYEEKAVDFILELAKVSEREVSREALFAEAEGDTGAAAEV